MNCTPTATVNELNEAFKESLERNGVMRKLRASLRLELFKCLQTSVQRTDNNLYSSSNEEEDSSALASKPIQINVPPENAIIDQLFIEYLEFNRYSYTLNIFRSEFSSETPVEGGCPRDVSVRAVEKDFGMTQQQDACHKNTGSSKLKVPLIYGIVTAAGNHSDRKYSCSAK